MELANFTKNKMYSVEIEAQNVKVGDFRVWNDGSFSKISKVEFSKTGKTLEITTLYYKEMAEYNGEKWIGSWKLDTRKCRATQKINIVAEESLSIALENEKSYIEKCNEISSKNKNINDQIVNIEDIKELEPVAEVAEVETIENIEELEVETVEKTNILKMLNGSINNIEMAKESLYHGKVYVVANSSIDKCFKTKKGAEGYIKRQSYISWYDEYSMEMVNAGEGLEIFEVLENEITDIKTDYALWYRELRNSMRYSHAWEVVENYVKKYLVSGDLFAYVTEQIELLKIDECVQRPAGYTLSEEDNKQLVKIAVEPVQKVKEEVKEVETTIEAAEQQENTLQVNYIIEESKHTKTGNVIYLVRLDRKVNKEEFKSILENIKALGGYWSRYTKTFIITDKEKAYSLVTQEVETVEAIENNTNTVVETPETSQPVKTTAMETIEMDSIEQYIVSEELSKRENDCHWVFRSKERNHTAEIQNYLNRCKNELLNALSGTQDQFLINSSIRFFNSYMKKYHALQLRLISNSASMPSVAVAGAGNYNFRKRDKLNDRYGKLLNEYGELTDHFNNKIAGIKRTIKKDKEQKTLNKIHEGIKTAPEVKTTKTTIKYNPSAAYNIFEGVRSETIAYKYNNYSIIKNWASWRIYDNTGNVVKIEGVEMITGTLKDAKLFLNYLVSLDNSKVA